MYHLWAKRLVGPALSKVACKVLLCSVTQLCLTLCEPMDYSPPGSLVHGISQARILKQAAISFFVGGGGGSSLPRDRTRVSCIVGRFSTTEPPEKPTYPCLQGTRAQNKGSAFQWGLQTTVIP